MTVIIKPLKYFAMKKNIFLYMTFIGLTGLLLSCEKDETKVIMLDNPILPKIVTLPDLTLESAHAPDTLIFSYTPVDPGFTASANYFLEACASGNGFKGAATIRVYFGPQDTLMTITEEALNKALILKKFPVGTVSPLDLRVRSVLNLDAGTGSPGSSTLPLAYLSEVTTVNVTPY
jgi:hypothetical protein